MTAEEVRHGKVDDETISVAIVIPTLNEAGSIRRSIDSLEIDSYPELAVELVVVDGGSTDGTIEAVKEIASRVKRINLIVKRGSNISEARNIGISSTRSDVVINFSGHAVAGPKFLPTLINRLVVSGPEVAGVGCGQRLPNENDSLVALSSYLITKSAIGGRVMRPYESVKADGLAEHIPCTAYRRSVLVEVGLYDSTNPYGDDADLSSRIRRKGYKLILTGDTYISLSPRSSVRKFAVQMFRYGRARARIMVKSRRIGNPLYLIPMIAFLYLSALLLSLAVATTLLGVLAVSVVLYLTLVLAFSLAAVFREGVTTLVVVMPTMYVVQLSSYGFGMVIEALYSATLLFKT
ncbi:MAG: glycosyltransferase [Thaumarchaeota archaeon]|nr:glycosyltransferase [Nitrososphaerota archaeon]